MRFAGAVLLAASWLPCAIGAAPPARDAAEVAMWIERTGSLHAQASEGVSAARAKRSLSLAVQETDRALAGAARDAPAALREHYALFSLWWRQQRAWLARAPLREAAAGQRERDDEGTWLADRGRRLAGEPPGPADEAWHAARLSQRVVRLALLRRGAESDALAQAHAEALDELRERLVRLQAGTRADSPAFAEIQVARSQFEFLSRALEERPLRGRAADVAARSADNLLEALQRAIRQLEGPLSPSPG